MKRDVYFGYLELKGDEYERTLIAAGNYANSLLSLKSYAEAKSLYLKMIPVTRRVLGEGDELTLRMKWNYARALYEDPGATLDDLREAVTTLEETEPTARRVLGGAHPLVANFEVALRDAARAALRAREETPSTRREV